MTARGVLVDSNVLLDIALADPTWAPWSARALKAAGDEAMLVVNPIIYAELAAGVARFEELDALLPPQVYRREDLPWSAAFLAGKAYVTYRRRGGERRSPLPDFYIGAHAAVAGYRLLTRDPTWYRGYFPTVEVIAPGP